METLHSIPGYTGYSITASGNVFCEGRLLKCKNGSSRSVRVRVKDSSGKTIRIAVAKLIALAFIPNPNNYSKIIFKDRNKNNLCADNIQWVSASEFSRFANGYAESDNLLGTPRRRREPDWIDPARVPLNGFVGYYITANGVVYRGNRIIKPIAKKKQSLKLRIRQGGYDRCFGLARLVADHFIANPRNCRHIIFKDRNNRNCRAENIAWVGGETFAHYCGIHTGPKKIILPREEAIKRCTDIFLKNYYKTLDESWLNECWEQVEKRMRLPDWDACRSDCYLYFIDRVHRFSLLKDPVGLMIVYMRGIRVKIKKEISPDMPAKAVLRTDESLRNLKSGLIIP